VFGIGGQELVILGLLSLILFGPAKAGELARDIGRFTSTARASIADFKSEFDVFGDDRDQENPGMPKYKKP
jgi:Sec-independent protein translocase protein TatA